MYSGGGWLGSHTNNLTLVVERVVQSCSLMPGLYDSLVASSNADHSTSGGRATDACEGHKTRGTGRKLTCLQKCQPRCRDQRRTSGLVTVPYPVGSSDRGQGLGLMGGRISTRVSISENFPNARGVSFSPTPPVIIVSERIWSQVGLLLTTRCISVLARGIIFLV